MRGDTQDHTAGAPGQGVRVLLRGGAPLCSAALLKTPNLHLLQPAGSGPADAVRAGDGKPRQEGPRIRPEAGRERRHQSPSAARGGGRRLLRDRAGQEVTGGGGSRKKGGLGSSFPSVGADSSAKPPTPSVPPPPSTLQGEKGSPQSAGAEGRKFKTSLLNLVLAPRPRHGDQHSAQARPSGSAQRSRLR